MIHNWVHSNFLQNKLYKTFNAEQESINFHEISWLEKLIDQCIINGSADLWHVSALLRLSDNEESNASIGFDHMKLILDQSYETRSKCQILVVLVEISSLLSDSLFLDSMCNSSFPRVLLSNRHWTVELLVESLWWHLSSHEPDTTILKKQHPWGTPLFLGLVLLKIGSHGSKETKMDSMLDSLQFEWSPFLAKFLLQVLR